ncbi:type II secretion system minor pseudopilin GspH [Alteromonas gracilis]|uniref:type II secretion system minor pseudopilin GspH n=1 Tax=Alteromonas gracilis TaxID=1479524 RepID=UPI0037369F5E
MQRRSNTPNKQHGFTLIEIMVVLLLIGLAAGYVMFNAFGSNHVDLLKSQAQRVQVLVDMASDFAVLNQRQLGIRFEHETNEYYFVYLDDEDKWQRLEDEKMYATHTVPEPFTFELKLDDLPWDVEDRLFDRDLFDEQLSVSDEGVEIGNDEDKRLPPPQVLIMSSGEITPFTLSFNYEGDFDDEPVYFSVQNQELPPLLLEGPLERPL